MAVQMRRVVTGHDTNGRAVVKIDEVSENIISARPGATSCVIWTTESFPVNNTGDSDEGLRKVGTTLKNGTVFRLVEFSPGVAPRNHRTDSIDYAVVMRLVLEFSGRGVVGEPRLRVCEKIQIPLLSPFFQRRIMLCKYLGISLPTLSSPLWKRGDT
jgi:hypothetical protein